VIPLKDNIRLAHVPIITIALVLANIVAYLLASSHGGSIISGPTNETLVHSGAIPYEFAHLDQHCDLGLSGFGQRVLCTGQAGVAGTPGPQPPTWETAFTAMFLQTNVLVLAIAVLFLTIFATTVENAMGRARFACFYLLGGLTALAVQIALAPNSSDPTLGAAGAIAAVLGAYIVLYPRARILTVAIVPFFLGPVEVPAWAMVVLWFAIEAALGALGLTAPLGASSAITYYAQIGGVSFGLLVVRAFAPRRSVELAAGH